MNYNDREKIIQLTPLWKGERLPDGRPKVEDKYLDALYGMTLGACVGWNVETNVNEDFEKAVSYFVYGSETNVIPFVDRIAEIHAKSATWYSFFCWTSWKSKDYFKDYTNALELSEECFEIAKQLKTIPDKKNIITYIVNAAEGVALLNEAGVQTENVIKTTVFIKNMDDFAKINAIYSEFFVENCPARSCVEVARLPKDVLIEIEAIGLKA